MQTQDTTIQYKLNTKSKVQVRYYNTEHYLINANSTQKVSLIVQK